ncbi:hypothetical protein EWM64_g10602, partial [Hericium alpestre]
MQALTLTQALGSLPSRLFFLAWQTRHLNPSSVKAFSTSLMVRREETPAMKALHDVPYVPSPSSSDLFEDWSDEYTSVSVPEILEDNATSIQTKGSNQRRPCDILRRLVQEGSWEDAEHVRQELVDAGTPIAPSPLYYGAARNVLARREPNPDRAIEFAHWWSLIPLRSRTHPGNFHSIEQLLFFRPEVDMPTVITFGIISAEKGYARRIGPLVVPHIVRYAEPDLAGMFLTEFVKADHKHEARYGQLSIDETMPRRYFKMYRQNTRKRWWSLAVRTHCLAARPLDAFELFKVTLQRGITLTNYTHMYLLGELQAHGHITEAAELSSLSLFELGCAKTNLTGASDAPAESTSPSVDPSQPVERNLALVLRSLKTSLNSGTPLDQGPLADFLDIYKTDARGGLAIQLLRSRAYRLSHTAVSAVALGELLHHHHGGEHAAVLYVFKKLFHIVSMPMHALRRHLPTRSDFPPHM